MAIAQVVGITRISRPMVSSYTEVEPHGLAYSFASVTGDASGGAITITVNTDPGFVYRLEALQAVIGESTVRVLFLQLNHQWLADAVPEGGNANQTFVALRQGVSTLTGFQIYGAGLDVTELSMLRRIPYGNLTNTHIAVLLAQWTFEVNTDTIVHEGRLFFSYWPKDAMTRPGFWNAFYEAPAPRFPDVRLP